MTKAIETNGLTKYYGRRRGCEGVSIHVHDGEIFGFLGPNGAGKSTFVKMLVGLLRPTAGEARVMGLPAGFLETRKQIGYLPELFRYQEWLTGREVLRLHSRLARVETRQRDARIDFALKLVGLQLRADERVRRYSKGMQQRLGLGCALISNPTVLFLDEPVSALDPGGRHDVRNLIVRLRDEGKTVFLNTHLLEDVEAICTSVALMNDGQVRAFGTVDSILRPIPMWECMVGGWTPELLAPLSELTRLSLKVESWDRSEGLATLVIEAHDREQMGWFTHAVMDFGLTLYEVKPRQHRLETWFLSITDEFAEEPTHRSMSSERGGVQ